MVYEVDKYRRTVKPIIETWFENRTYSTPLSDIGVISISTYCPIIVVGYLLLEVYGPNEELSKRIDYLRAFYKVEDVII